MAVTLLAVLAFIAGGPVLLIVALGLSALGDAFLAHDGERAFLGGLASFLAAHIAYVALFVGLAGSGAGMPQLTPLTAAIGLAALVAGAVLVSRAGALKLPVAFYVAAIAAMGVTAAPYGGAILAGALAFMASDTLLGTETFVLTRDHPARAATSPAVWVLYYLGQAAITLGVLLR